MELESQLRIEKRTEKEQEWHQLEQEVEGLTDKLGKKIDEKIKFTVVALKANGFGTTGSCEGHLDQALPYPWVEVESPLAEKLLSDPRYNKLKEKARAMLKDGKPMREEEKQEYHGMVAAQIQENELEHQRLLKLLNEFYESRPKKKGAMRLGIKKGPWNQSRIQPKDMPTGHPADIQESWPEEVKKKNLALYRKEMGEFAEFLKSKFSFS